MSENTEQKLDNSDESQYPIGSQIFDVDALVEDAPGRNKCVICEERFADDEVENWYYRDKIPKPLLKNFRMRSDTATYEYVMCHSCHDFFDKHGCIKKSFRIGYTIVDGLIGTITILDLQIASPLAWNEEPKDV